LAKNVSANQIPNNFIVYVKRNLKILIFLFAQHKYLQFCYILLHQQVFKFILLLYFITSTSIQVHSNL